MSTGELTLSLAEVELLLHALERHGFEAEASTCCSDDDWASVYSRLENFEDWLRHLQPQ